MSRAREIKWQDSLEERSNAVFLVRNILGCTCPEDIFDHYQVIAGKYRAKEAGVHEYQNNNR